MTRHWPRRTLTLLLVSLVTLAALCTVSFSPLVSQHKAHAAPEPDGTPLLLVHGYYDTCSGAFGSTAPYLKSHGWQTIDDIGYYSNDGGCDHIIGSDSQQTEVSKCHPLLSLSTGQAAMQTLDDPIEHIACNLAYYINSTYPNQDVTVLAHSMGGLIIRMALACSGYSTSFCNDTNLNNDFPDQKLWVSRVVTVATPHAGLDSATQYAIALGGLFDPTSANAYEVKEMYETSSFITSLKSFAQKPQGANGTYWALMGGTGQCDPGDQNCDYLNIHSSDGLLYATTTMGMQADFKVLYGPGSLDNTIDQEFYSHAPMYNCGPYCLQPPYFLNDLTDNRRAEAWLCWQNCGYTGRQFTEFGQSFPVRHSVAEMSALLSPPRPTTYAASNMDGRMELFSCSPNDIINHTFQTSFNGGWAPQNALISPQPFLCIGAPAIGTGPDGRLELFAISSRGFLYHLWQTPGQPGGWSGWQQLADVDGSGNLVLFTGVPSVAMNPDGILELFARATDGNIYHIWQGVPESGWNGHWDALYPPGFAFLGNPVVSVNRDGRLEVFAQGSATDYIYSMHKITANNGWTGTWNQVRGTVFPPNVGIAVGLHKGGYLEIFARRSDGTIWHTYQDFASMTWSNIWNPLPYTTSFGSGDDPAVGNNPDGRLEVVAIGGASDVWHEAQTGPGTWFPSWSELAQEGHTFVGTPTILRNGGNGLEVFVSDSSGRWYHTWYALGGGWTNNWTALT